MLSARIHQFKSWLNSPTDGHVIGLFRLVFGLFMAYETSTYFTGRLIPDGLLKPQVHFRFDYFEWIPLFPESVLYLILVVMGLAALAIAAGVFFRWACWVFSLCMFYFLFQEVSYYNNHLYLFALLPLLLSVTDADRFFSLRRNPQSKPAGKKKAPKQKHSGNHTSNSILQTSNSKIPRWQQFILQAQIVILYFYAGVVKFKSDWLLRQEPMTSLVRGVPDQHWLAPLVKHDFNIYLFTYGGFALDILAPILLWYKPIRNWAWIPFALFHLMNSQLFDDIGIFPFVMLFAMILFFDTKEIPILRSWIAGRHQLAAKTAESGALPPPASRTRNVLIGYFAFQLLFPLRGLLLPNPLDYTTIGNRFAWRVKADTRKPEEMSFFVQHPVTGQTRQVEIQTFLNPMQIKMLAIDPRAIRTFARFLKAEVARQGAGEVLVKARIRFGYNGRAPQFFVNPDVDLASVDYSPFRKLEWVVAPVGEK